MDQTPIRRDGGYDLESSLHAGHFHSDRTVVRDIRIEFDLAHFIVAEWIQAYSAERHTRSRVRYQIGKEGRMDGSSGYRGYGTGFLDYSVLQRREGWGGGCCYLAHDRMIWYDKGRGLYFT